jgi:hypothetical protein
MPDREEPQMSDENGDAPALPQASEIALQLHALVTDRENALAKHDLVRDKIVTELRTYEKALAALTGEPKKAGRPKQGQSGERTKPSKLSEERIGEIETLVREYAADHEEFRQVDLRAAYSQLPSGGTMTSGMSALAFEELRQRNVLRVSRIEGNSKFYRLTREALNA